VNNDFECKKKWYWPNLKYSYYYLRICLEVLKKTTKYSESEKPVSRPRIESGSPELEAEVLPLDSDVPHSATE
jgi:hypothetical protein